MTKTTRLTGGVAAIAALAGAIFLYSAHPVRGSDHQDSPATVANPAADITDVFVYQAPDNSNNVVLQMDVWPLITHAEVALDALDPNVMYQFKIDNSGDGVEDRVLQVKANANGTGQTVSLFGPANPNETGTSSTFVRKTGSAAFGDRSGTPLANGVKLFVGPTKDPFFFDLLQFFANIPDRYYGCQPGYTNGFGVNCTPPTSLPGFRGFTTAFNTAHGVSCLTTAPVDALSANSFNVLAIIAEVPRALLQGSSESKIHVWATTSTTSGT
jgi:hypothetical protein